ncbi:hypothetical protein [Thermococcus sp. JCM 11816]|uniref:hypothetical protein n=1 Tax=Thermococcus sp. (strain JCM 11816 / KS-1) TaxID=1295125 RepID=UPI0006D04B0C
MKFRDFLIHLSILGLATVWEIFLAYQRWLEKYYIRGESIKLWDRIFTCHIWYSPTPIFVILVLLPAIALLVLYVYIRSYSQKIGFVNRSANTHSGADAHFF